MMIHPTFLYNLILSWYNLKDNLDRIIYSSNKVPIIIFLCFQLILHENNHGCSNTFWSYSISSCISVEERK
jgi:hypothetical protein